MTEQPAERTILGLTHKRHMCGKLPLAALCGYLPDPGTPRKPGADKHYTPIPDDELGYYQACVVCTELWENARASNLHCGRCGERIES